MDNRENVFEIYNKMAAWFAENRYGGLLEQSHLKPKGILLFTSGTEHGEAWGINGGENLFHGSLSTQGYQEVLGKHNFKVLKHVVNDPDCGGATVWMVQNG